MDLPEFPRHVGGYELLLPIGIGGMGTVYLAEREVVSGVVRPFAIKLLHPQLRADNHVADDMLEEAKLAARIAHPHVVQTVEAGNDAGHVYLTMEYVEGVTLADMVRAAIRRKQPLPLPIIARIFCDALDGLHAAHEACGEDGQPLGLVHRDFSPQNVLISVDGGSKLTDFGIAKAISRIGATATGVVKGKISYLSPEQAMGQRLDRRADIWAAGVCLWEALCARRLFRAENDAAVLLHIVSGGVIPAPSSERPDVPSAIDEVVFAALDRNRDARLPTAEAFRQRLESAFRSESGIAERSEVARFVSTIAKNRFVERRRKADEARHQRVSDPNVSGVRPAVAGDSEPPATLPAARRTGLIAYAIGGVTLLGVLVMVARTGPAPQLARGGWDRTLAALDVPRPVPVTALQLRGDANIAQVQIGDGPSQLVPAPQRRLSLPLPADLSLPFELEAVSGDGRRAIVTVEAWPEGALEVVFPPSAAREPPEATDEEDEPPPPTKVAIRPPPSSAKPDPAPTKEDPPPEPKPVIRPPPVQPPTAPGLGPSPYKKRKP